MKINHPEYSRVDIAFCMNEIRMRFIINILIFRFWHRLVVSMNFKTKQNKKMKKEKHRTFESNGIFQWNSILDFHT